jgi:hypothetical protein
MQMELFLCFRRMILSVSCNNILEMVQTSNRNSIARSLMLTFYLIKSRENMDSSRVPRSVALRCLNINSRRHRLQTEITWTCRATLSYSLKLFQRSKVHLTHKFLKKWSNRMEPPSIHLPVEIITNNLLWSWRVLKVSLPPQPISIK